MTDRIDHATRRIAASPATIYAAFVDPTQQARWLPPTGMTAHFDRFEPHPGGQYEMTLTYAVGGSGKTRPDADVVSGRFVELKPGERIVQTADFVSDDPRFAGTMTMIWTLRSIEGETAVTIEARDVPPGISAKDHRTGLESTLANLASFVE